ncbi:DUF6227 family protein [Streptomyces albidoflavus]
MRARLAQRMKAGCVRPHMCEVYETEDAAQSAMERRAASL